MAHTQLKEFSTFAFELVLCKRRAVEEANVGSRAVEEKTRESAQLGL